MTPEQLRRKLESLYGANLSRWQLCKFFADDLGTTPDSVQKWLNGIYPVKPWVALCLRTLEAEKAEAD